ncbi:hypothetical protein HDU96_009613 [Phlyctochytrium bullatum]|nr:hypothetical protein HDU96_009613 [Phlyctochytrium bullatum]
MVALHRPSSLLNAATSSPSPLVASTPTTQAQQKQQKQHEQPQNSQDAEAKADFETGANIQAGISGSNIDAIGSRGASLLAPIVPSNGDLGHGVEPFEAAPASSPSLTPPPPPHVVDAVARHFGRSEATAASQSLRKSRGSGESLDAGDSARNDPVAGLVAMTSSSASSSSPRTSGHHFRRKRSTSGNMDELAKSPGSVTFALSSSLAVDGGGGVRASVSGSAGVLLKHSSSQISIMENAKHAIRPSSKASAKLPSIATSLAALPTAIPSPSTPTDKSHPPGSTTHSRSAAGNATTNEPQSAHAGRPTSGALSRKKGGALVPFKVQIRSSLCGEFTVVFETYGVPLLDGHGFIPMDRRCTTAIYGHAVKAKGAVLLIPGFASNRAVFDMGGGKGRDGPCFSEYLAKRGYDTFSIDLRGTRQAMRLGSRPPAFLKEHVEIDVPSAINFIKAVGNYEKVYLIGHSMGGAISCAVAGHVPDDVAGIVHLAGLYHYTLPYVSDVVDFYKSRVPQSVQNAISKSAGFALKSALSILTPTLSSLLHFLSPPSSLPGTASGPDTASSSSTSTTATNVGGGAAPTPSAENMQVARPTPSLLSRSRSVFVELRRRHLPVRSCVDAILFIRKFVPGPLERLLINCLHPSPWIPYSVDDPWSMVEQAAESPTIGIWLAIQKMAVRDDLYNAWVMESSTHRAEVRDLEDATGVQSSSAATVPVSSTTEANVVANGNMASHMGLANVTAAASKATGGHQKLKAALQPVLKHTADTQDATEASTSAEPSLAAPRDSKFEDAETRPSAAPKPGTAPAPPVPAPSSVNDNPSWNELAPYLSRFEQLEHLPLFFCHANADAVLRTEDTMAGYRRSGSRWKEVIQYEGESSSAAAARRNSVASDGNVSGARKPSRKETGGSVGPDASSSPSAAMAAAAVATVATTPAATVAALEGFSHRMAAEDGSASGNASSSASSSLTASPEVPLARQGSRSSGKRRLAASIRLTPLKDDSGVCLDGGVRGEKMVASPSTVSESSDATTAASSSSSSSSGGENAKPVPRRKSSGAGQRPIPVLKPRYSVPESFSYGHVDILGGRHADKVWERIADWLDATSAREREWRFRRRYSAK